MNSSKNLEKMELVSPAGDHDQLVAAINAGADAVYLGFKKFNARAYAENFEINQLKKAVNIAHMNGVRVYLALNILIKDSEIAETIYFLNEYLDFCRDGIIIQDLGLYRIISELYPGIRLHASTQMNIHDLESVRLLKEIGFKRVVLAREMTLQEIINITKNCDIEIETFIHGSQCYSYSGNCYFSSFTGSRSGNRGRCTQPCSVWARPGVTVRIAISADRNSSTMCTGSRPSASGPGIQIEATAMVGMVSPIDAMAEP